MMPAVVKTRVIVNRRKATLHAHTRARQSWFAASTPMRSCLSGISGYEHGVIDHAVEYVSGQRPHERAGELLEPAQAWLKGTYISVEPFHLFRYLDEQVFRFNERKGNDHSRFKTLLSAIAGKRLTYKELIGNDIPAALA